ncbi:unnamed protein product [Schistosoma margrebowiei]|uniref:hydroxyacylglutathione hydrolase n=1 Tax=Schistosoma margrebowiei TaxID=48269 RepID=A0A183MIU5_9TREM|nr:unnamed protein product [Schistosoma margrebowiei]
MEVITIPALSDNYMYVVIDRASNVSWMFFIICAVVDPVEPDKILNAVTQRGLRLESILTTHHHSDHAGGNLDLVTKYRKQGLEGVKVYGGDDRIGGLTDTVSHGHKIKIGSNLNVCCLATPCHTTGHICYLVTEENSTKEGVVFTGDTLFLGGCGRFFEGTAEQMFKALIEVLSKLPKPTKVYCGHEYTVKNLEFGLTVEPKNEALKHRLEAVRRLRASNQASVPGTIGEELATNPFMRVCETDVLAHAKTTDPIKAMKTIREEKDHF